MYLRNYIPHFLAAVGGLSGFATLVLIIKAIVKHELKASDKRFEAFKEGLIYSDILRRMTMESEKREEETKPKIPKIEKKEDLPEPEVGDREAKTPLPGDLRDGQ